jgi:LPS O-antigen subunit length determinant protein (WzzB/FepE family)
MKRRRRDEYELVKNLWLTIIGLGALMIVIALIAALLLAR